MELDMPITRVLLNSGPSSVRDSKIAKLTVQPAQVLNKLPVQLATSLSKIEPDGSGVATIGKMCDSTKYKLSVARRNERERRRVQHVNRTFDTLRHHVQGYKNANKKMSKVETLRCAVEYIRELQTILGLSQEDKVLCAADDNEPYDQGNISTNFDYQMPITPSSPTQPSQTLSFEYPSGDPFSSPSSNTSSPLPPSPPASTPPAHAEIFSLQTTCSLPASPVLSVDNLSTGTTILADRLRMPPLNASTESVVVKQELFECITPEVPTGISFDFNANSTAPVLLPNAVCNEDHVLYDRSYSQLTAALQTHPGQSLSHLNFNDYQCTL
ncbi:uncharacterized protein LOC111273033 [Varroa jacobsoni]|uniref:uncharacterized protein LOC111273033 n=1 Tax=Varroa jacobsoni TaxID=62625 RepID=UPI000BF9CADB|nr:uncharacterized protein LOC111273033 [Varroa jacobsoni]